MTLISKIRWVLGILMVFILIITTNLIDRDNFRRINDSVVAIYEDRLVAKDLIFEFSRLIQEKEIALTAQDFHFYTGRNKTINTEIEGLTLDYLETRLTKKEERVFHELQDNLKILTAYEEEVQADRSVAIMKQINIVKDNLHELSKIQLEEGRRQVAISKKAMATVELFTQLEIYFLIVLAILIQFIIIYKPR